jgi:hypothetical protein
MLTKRIKFPPGQEHTSQHNTARTFTMTSRRPLTVKWHTAGSSALASQHGTVVLGLGRWLVLYCHASLRNWIRVRIQCCATWKFTPETTLGLGQFTNYNAGNLYLSLHVVMNAAYGENGDLSEQFKAGKYKLYGKSLRWSTRWPEKCRSSVNCEKVARLWGVYGFERS